MTEKHESADKARRDLDATALNARATQGGEDVVSRHSGSTSGSDRAGGGFDLTTPNIQLVRDEVKANRSAPKSDGFDLTAMNVNLPDRDEEEDAPPARPDPEPLQRPSPPSPATESSPAPPRHVPRWLWLTGGSLAVLVAGVVASLFILWPFNSAFTLKVLEAPAGSRVFVDNLASGVRQADGTVVVQGLKSDEPRDVRVTHEGFDEWSTTITGEAGTELVITAKLAPKVKPAVASDKPEGQIDYRGPMILIPAGSFVMGDNNHHADERPEHEVNLPHYYIDKYEVTNEQYRKFCDETRHPHPPSPWWDEQYFTNQPQSPVVGISWDDAAAYAKWAGKRLPKEEEWEKAAGWDPHANRKRQWPWGDAPEQNRANLGLKRETLELVAVNENPGGASAYGVYNMAGNVAEWTDAYYQPYDGNQTANQEYGTRHRVMRGGACFNSIGDARTTRRLYRPPQYTAQEEAAGGTFVIGFRCVVSADDPKLQEHLKARAEAGS